MTPTATILLLGAGELGREVAIAAKRLGCRVIACDRYPDAPAMQVADASAVIDMLDGDAIAAVVAAHAPTHIVPEIEAIRTEALVALEADGHRVVPTARAVALTMNRDAIRDHAARGLGLRTSPYAYAETADDAVAAARAIGLPVVIKPVMSSSGKGQSTARTLDEVAAAFAHATAAMRGDRPRVIVEGFVAFDREITLLTVAHAGGISIFPPVGHRQEAGDYRESWMPAAVPAAALAEAEAMARTIVADLCGASGRGLFGVEFFIAGEEVLFSELSPRPHDTGMVTLIGRPIGQFEAHVRAFLGLPVPDAGIAGPMAGAAASAVVLADADAQRFAITGLAEALVPPHPGIAIDARLFGKPRAHPGRRMGVTLAHCPDGTADAARHAAVAAAAKLRVVPKG